MNKMKVQIKELNPNPFRDLENYPFNAEKIDRLKKSIEATGFWDNILARQVNGKIQIAYGHHRLKALQEVYTPEYQVEVPIKDISDELMLKIMANENMEEWQSSVAVIDETVRAVRKFLLNPDLTQVGQKHSDYIGVDEIAIFLGWNVGRVTHSLQRINAVESGKVDKQAVEMIPTAKAASAFASKAKDHNLTVNQQRKVAQKIKDSGDHSKESITKAIMQEAYPARKKEIEREIEEKKLTEFDEYLVSLAKRAVDMKDEIAMLKSLKKEIKEYSYDQFENRLYLKISLESLSKTIINLINELENE